MAVSASYFNDPIDDAELQGACNPGDKTSQRRTVPGKDETSYSVPQRLAYFDA